jgi:hypothetical protein
LVLHPNFGFFVKYTPRLHGEGHRRSKGEHFEFRDSETVGKNQNKEAMNRELGVY